MNPESPDETRPQAAPTEPEADEVQTDAAAGSATGGPFSEASAGEPERTEKLPVAEGTKQTGEPSVADKPMTPPQPAEAPAAESPAVEPVAASPEVEQPPVESAAVKAQPPAPASPVAEPTVAGEPPAAVQPTQPVRPAEPAPRAPSTEPETRLNPVVPVQPLGSASTGGPVPPGGSAGKPKWLVPALVAGVVVLLLLVGGVTMSLGDDDGAADTAGAPAAATSGPAGDAAAGDDDPAADPDSRSGAAASATASAATGRGGTGRNAAGGGGTTSAAPSTEAKPVPKGKTVQGGGFEFVVHGVTCGLNQVGDSLLTPSPRGSFCQVDMTAKNITQQARVFHSDTTVTVEDSGGQEFGADSAANLAGNQGAAGFLEPIASGASVRAFVYFDVPAGTELARVVFDGGLLSMEKDAVVTL